jgi:ATP-binding cassette subfamily B protein
MLLRLYAATKGARDSLLGKAILGVLIMATYLMQAMLAARGIRYVFEANFSLNKFLPIVIGILILIAARAFLTWRREIQGKRAAEKLKETLRLNLFQHLFSLGPSYMDEERTGKVQSVFTDGVEALEVFLVNYIPQLLVTVIGLLATISYIIMLDMAVGIIIIGAVLICLITPLFWDKLMNRIGHGHWDSYGDMNAEFIDAMQGITTLKAFNASDAKGKELESKANTLYERTMQKLSVSLTSSAVVGLASSAGTALSIGIGALKAAAGMLDPFNLPVLLFLSTECFRPITDLNQYWHQSFLGLTAAEKMHEFLDADVSVKNEGKTELALDSLPSIEFSGVNFAYKDSRRPALNNASIQIKPGTTVALAGQSGAGKTTVVNLLLRFFDPQSGVILINNLDIRSMPLDRLRAMIAVVFQDTYLFYGSVADNLMLAKPDADMDDIIHCCKLANAHDFIEKLPEGYNTIVGERGVRFSGGERQRLSIARAMLKNAPILILDEATSSVDASNEHRIQESLERLMENRTTLMIAHRLSTIKNSDCIFVLDNGRVVEYGSAAELSEKNGVFATLIQSQLSVKGETGA